MIAFELVTRRRHCLHVGCWDGAIPCDCLTKAGKPPPYCRVTRSQWVWSHPCPICCPPENGDTDA